jgi:hypothetical protein
MSARGQGPLDGVYTGTLAVNFTSDSNLQPRCLLLPWSSGCAAHSQKEPAVPRMSNTDLDDYVRRQALFYGRDGIAVSSFMLMDELAAGGHPVGRMRVTRSLRRLVSEGVLQQITPYHFCTTNICSR